ncbi:MAG: transcriptional repressor [Bacteroidota bacterium]|nr:transcriptional repressor [Bacteroidota bacterium]
MGVVRKTKHLEQVLNVFRQSSDALSAGMLLDALANRINKSTVYRMLEKLEDDGVIHSFLTMDQIRFYALCKGFSSGCHVDSHAHFQCTSCKRVSCFSEEIVLPTPKRAHITGAQVLLMGQCESCLS